MSCEIDCLLQKMCRESQTIHNPSTALPLQVLHSMALKLQLLEDTGILTFTSPFLGQLYQMLITLKLYLTILGPTLPNAHHTQTLPHHTWANFTKCSSHSNFTSPFLGQLYQMLITLKLYLTILGPTLPNAHHTQTLPHHSWANFTKCSSHSNFTSPYFGQLYQMCITLKLYLTILGRNLPNVHHT